MDRVLIRFTINKELWNKFYNYMAEQEMNPGAFLRMFIHYYLNNQVNIVKVNLRGETYSSCFFIKTKTRDKFKEKCLQNGLKESEVLTYFINDYLMKLGNL